MAKVTPVEVATVLDVNNLGIDTTNTSFLDSWKEFEFYHKEKGPYKVILPDGTYLYVSPYVKYSLIELKSPLVSSAYDKMVGSTNVYDFYTHKYSKCDFSNQAIILFFLYLTSGQYLENENLYQLHKLAHMYMGTSEIAVELMNALDEDVVKFLKFKDKDPLVWSADHIDSAVNYLVYSYVMNCKRNPYIETFEKIVLWYFPYALWKS